MADSGFVEQAEELTEHARIARLSCVDAIRDRRGDVVCFTPGLIVTCGGMTVDPAAEFAVRFAAAKDLQPFCVVLPPGSPPFFNGIGVSQINGEIIDWDRRLYCIAASRSAACMDFIGGIGLKGKDSFASVVQYELDIPDPTTLTLKDMIRVQIFGVLTENRIIYLEPQLTSPPVLASTPAGPHLQAASPFKFNPFSDEAFKRLKDAL